MGAELQEPVRGQSLFRTMYCADESMDGCVGTGQNFMLGGWRDQGVGVHAEHGIVPSLRRCHMGIEDGALLSSWRVVTCMGTSVDFEQKHGNAHFRSHVFLQLPARHRTAGMRSCTPISGSWEPRCCR